MIDLDLPPDMQAKESSTSYRKFFQKYGGNAFELEAVPPRKLQSLLREAIDSILDAKAFNAEIDREKDEEAKLSALRRAVRRSLSELTDLHVNGNE